MGMINRFLDFLFGNGRNVISETAEVFRENAENGAERSHSLRKSALDQYAAEFNRDGKSRFDRFMDGINRIPRPAMALGTLALFVVAMVDPVWFAERMQGLSLVPEPLWWLLGVIVSFYFGARHQAKGQEFQQSIIDTMARTPRVVENINALRSVDAPKSPEVSAPSDINPALEAWRAEQRG